MSQDRESGAQANVYGHETSRLIAEKLGAISVSDKSNEFAFEGRLVTIRCARKGTEQVGVSYNMLKRVNLVIAAFEADNKIYKLYDMTPSLYEIYMRDSKDEGRVGLVTRKTFIEFGKALTTVTL